jgi:hypothetical protein
VIQGERQFDLIVRMQEPFRENMEAIKNLLVATPDGQHLPLSQFADIQVGTGASFIYRESNSRYIGVQFSVEGRDLAGAVGEARRVVADQVQLPIGYTLDWGGEYKDYLAAIAQLKIIGPLTVVIILLIIFALYGNLKFPLLIMFSVLVTEPVGGLLALKLTHTDFSVSSGLGFVALMGVAVQTSVILYSFINKLRLEGKDILTATHEAALLRIYRRLHPGNPPQIDKAKKLFQEKFFDENRYRLGKVGRFRLNRKFNQDVPMDAMMLHPQDIINAVRYNVYFALLMPKGYQFISHSVADGDYGVRDLSSKSF